MENGTIQKIEKLKNAEICLIFYKKRNKLFHEVPRREGDLEVSSAIQVAMQTLE